MKNKMIQVLRKASSGDIFRYFRPFEYASQHV